MKDSRSDRLLFGRIVAMISLGLILSASFSQPAVAAFTNGESASLVLGQSSFTTNECTITQNGLCFPHGAAFDSSGNLWVIDGSNSRLLEFTRPFSNGESASLVVGQSSFTGGCIGGFTGPSTQSGLCNPSGLAFDSKGNMWVADTLNSRVLEFKTPFSNGESASRVIGQSSFTTNTCTILPPTQNGLCRPGGLAFDSSGNLWVSDSSNNRVLEFTPPFSNGQSSSLVIGQSSFTTATTPCTFGQSGVCGPSSVAFDSSGDLWVADFDNSRVLEFAPPFSSGEGASLVIGQPGFISSGCFVTQSGLCRPSGLAFDPKGNLWVSDISFGRVLEFTPPFSNGENALLVIGQPDFGTCCENFTTASNLHEPFGIAFDSKGDLWVADTFNSRVLGFAHHHHHHI